MKKVEAILYAATAEEGRTLLIEAQKELAGGVFLDEVRPADHMSIISCKIRSQTCMRT